MAAGRTAPTLILPGQVGQTVAQAPKSTEGGVGGQAAWSERATFLRQTRQTLALAKIPTTRVFSKVS